MNDYKEYLDCNHEIKLLKLKANYNYISQNKIYSRL